MNLVNSVEFGPFLLDPERRLLLRDGEPLTLTPKTLDTLIVLVRERARVVEKRELMELLWPDSVVDENNLTQQISALRKVLGERPDEGRYIRTVPGRGYRFVGEVQVEKLPRPAKKKAAWLLAAIPVLALAAFLLPKPAPRPHRSIAILPFKSLGSSDEYLGIGMTDVLITRLSNVHGLVVRPTRAIRRFDRADVEPVAAGRQLRVDSVLDGSIQRAGEQVRVTVRLYDVAGGTAVWGQTLDEKFSSIFAVEDSIAERLATALALRLTPAERAQLTRRYTDNIEAHRLYLSGVYHSRSWTAAGFDKAVDEFHQALAIDPTYALAYAGLADAYYRQSTVHLPLQEAAPKAKAAALAALQLDDSLAEAHTSLAAIRFRYDWDFAGAEREFRRAIALNPNDVFAHQWYSELLTALGRMPEAVSEAELARIDPLSPEADWELGLALLFGGRPHDAAGVLGKSVAANGDLWLTRSFLAWSLLEDGDCERSLAEYAKARAIDDNDDVRGQLIQANARCGHRDQAQKLFDELRARNGVSPFYVAVGYAGLGDREQALEWLRKAYAERAELLVFIKVAPSFAPLRGDPRFIELEQRVGLAGTR